MLAGQKLQLQLMACLENLSRVCFLRAASLHTREPTEHSLPAVPHKHHRLYVSWPHYRHVDGARTP